ncbi:WD40/YVTN/BNR-like repeat-containing protein [Variovorax sp. RA8]|uniref:WD40/YVTN/BNR-like repeat-containing protein n=1 Tax=Variovorax sp. (strain JCM 16519 / RA8) TaxID=662548 RepID=UPI0013174ADE|nr:hypothetical protein [Variovorax sp. RA8]VTU32383.1 putative protein related to plant photosystem II stability/assembly factor [Variovorax sp. RA8]
MAQAPLNQASSTQASTPADQAAEIGSTGYVCNGTDGSIAASESNTLASVVGDAVAANCAGGSKVIAGVDGNANGVLDADEVSATSYICNCAGGPQVDVTGVAVQAQPNTCYIARNATAQVVVTLPASPAIGDVVRVRGAGLGGWKIAQNPGQAVDTKSLGGMAGANWTVRESNLPLSSVDGQGTVISRSRMVFSADGSTLAAAVSGGQIYTSTDNGASWTARESNRWWTSIASSTDGTKLVAVDGALGQLYTSTDSGVSWTPRESGRMWSSVASSVDGSKLVAAVDVGGQLYTSTDSGVSWTARESAHAWTSVASSADGSKLVAVAADDQIYTSIDSGVTWIARESSRPWYWVAASADASRMVAIAFGSKFFMSEASTTLGTGGSIGGTASDSIDLRYVGNGVFTVLSHEGSLAMQ